MSALRTAVLVTIFAIQVAGIIYAKFVPTRYLCWAPYDQISFYRIEVDKEGRLLSPDEIERRYHMPAAGRENRAIQHVLNAISQYEATYGRTDRVTVRVVYRVNGKPEETWTLPG